ncbi:MAG: ATP-binding protein [Planctomycetota bacterium]
MKSIRARLILGVLLAATLCLAASGVAIYVNVRNRLILDQDSTLVAIAKSTVPSMIREWGGRAGPPGPPGPLPPDDFPAGGRGGPRRPLVENPLHRMDVLFQWRRHDGTSIGRSEALGEGTLPRIGAEQAPAPVEDIDQSAFRFESITLADGSPARAAGLRCLPAPHPPDSRAGRTDEPPPPFEFTFALETSDLWSSLADLRWLLIATWLVTSLACAGILSLVVHTSLRPLSRLGREIGEMDEAVLGRRFEAAGAPLELVPVIEQLNDLLARIGNALEREQAFSADAAHELRTPLSGLRATLEVSLGRERSSEEYREASRQCLAITLQMQSMVEGLLEMARGGAGGEITEVNLAKLIEECWEPHAPAAARRHLRLELSIPSVLRLETDARLLRRIILNLIDNAVDYSDEDGVIEIAALEEPGALAIRASNPAASAPPDLPSRACDAFWRADTSRTDTGHVGLGLALSRRIAGLLGGTLSAELEDGRFSVSLRLRRK